MPFQLTFNNTFPEPQSVEDAKERSRQLLLDIQHIQSQLGSRPRRDNYEWRRRAIVALNITLTKRRLLNDWVASNRVNSRMRQSPDLIGEIYGLTQRLITTHQHQTTEDERVLLKRVQEHLLTTSRT